VYIPPHPPYAARGEGCRLIDVEGRELLDLQNNYTALVHGHAHPQLVEAAIRAIEDGSCFGLPTAAEVDLAEMLAERIPWAGQWRFTNSGTEAVMIALRLARAATGRDALLRFDHAYHGSYDAALVPGSPGVPEALAREIISVPFDDLEATETALEEHGERLACVLVDAIPNRAGLRPASLAFIESLREETRSRGILLVQDEVLSFRLAYGGIHSLYGVEPDLIVLGKLIGGGFPVGALGGRAELMGLFDPHGSRPLSHGGTFTANPVTLRAGMAALELLDREAVDRLNRLGDRLRGQLFDQGWCVTGQGSLIRLHVSDPTTLWWRAYDEGVLIAGTGLLCVSTPMDESVIDEAGERMERVWTRDRGAG
jgi:glutamate-1-semialdehyde 2,1-aminomutase